MESNHRRARLQRAALPLSYFGEMVRVAVIETASSEWRSGARPSSYTRNARLRPSGYDAAAFAIGLACRAEAPWREGWWEAEGIEPPAAKGLRLRRSAGPAGLIGASRNLAPAFALRASAR